jgi:hypothetical protein
MEITLSVPMALAAGAALLGLGVLIGVIAGSLAAMPQPATAEDDYDEHCACDAEVIPFEVHHHNKRFPHVR